MGLMLEALKQIEVGVNPAAGRAIHFPGGAGAARMCPAGGIANASLARVP